MTPDDPSPTGAGDRRGSAPAVHLEGPRAWVRGLRGVVALAVAGGSLVNLACADDPLPADAGSPDATFIGADAQAPRDAGPRDVDAGGPVDAGIEMDGGALDAELPDAQDPCLAPAVETLTASTATAAVPRLAGKVVALVGTATTTALECTDRACPPEDPCCNECTARIRVGPVRLAASECFAVSPSCMGDECNQTCRPPLLGLEETFRGVLSTAAPDLQLLLHGVE